MTKRRGWSKPEVEQDDIVTELANYPGDVTHAVGEAMGPDARGLIYNVVEATYDAATDRTRLGFAPLGRIR